MSNFLRNTLVTLLVVFTTNITKAEEAWFFEPDAINKPMRFINAYNGGNCIGCEWMAAEGIITKDTPKKFKQFIGDNFRTSLVIHSTGGDIEAALEMGKIIREHELEISIGKSWTDITSTDDFRYHEIIDGQCTDACAYALLGGSSRYARAGGYGLVKTDISQSQLTNYLTQMGIKTIAFAALTNQASGEIYFPTEAELIHAGIDNSTDLFSKATLLPYGKNGKVVEIRHLSGYYATPKTPRRFRLYCRGNNKAPYFTILQNPLAPDMAEYDNWANIVDRVKSINIQLNKGGYVTVPVKVAAHFNGKQNKALAFELLNLPVDKFKDIKSLGITLENIPREFTPIVDRLHAHFGDVNAQITTTLQNCIE